MANESTDVLMTFLNGGEGVAAECSTVWNISDSMKTDFSTGSFFEIDDFSIGGGLESEDSDEKSSSGSTSGKGDNSLVDRSGNNKGKGDTSNKKSARGNKFANYILSGSLVYPIDMQEISISRQFDKASPVFLASCLNLSPFTKAVIVKRKVVGGSAGQGVSVNLMGFLRMEFTSPLITSVEWEDGEIVKEKIKFVCRGFTVIYKPQKHDGTLGEQVSTSWKPSRKLAGSGK